MIKDHAISPLFSNITPDTENDKTIIAEWLPHPMYGVWLHVPCVWSKSTSMSIHVMSVTTFFVCLGPELCQTIRVTSLITSHYKNTTPLHNASVTTTCKYEEQPVVIPGTFRSNANPSSPDLRNYHHHLCSPFPVSALLPPSLCYVWPNH